MQHGPRAYNIVGFLLLLATTSATDSSVLLDDSNTKLERHGNNVRIVISAFDGTFEVDLVPSETAAVEIRAKLPVLLSGNSSVIAADGTSAFNGKAIITLVPDSGLFSGQLTAGDATYVIEVLSETMRMRRVAPPSSSARYGDGLHVDRLESEWAQRLRPAVAQGHICEMQVVVDRSLFLAVNRSAEAAAALVMRTIEAVNVIYAGQSVTAPVGAGASVQLRLRHLVIADDVVCSAQPSIQICRPQLYATDSDYFLRMHSQADRSRFCLSYLFTSTDFRGTLGVAYVAGVCAEYGRVRDERTGVVEFRSTNTGFVSIVDPGEDSVQAQHTLAHEVGHSLGSSHDLSSKCSVAYDGYLMAPVAPRLDLPTSSRFSPCSLKAIAAVMDEMRVGKRAACFVSAAQVSVEVNTTVDLTRFLTPHPYATLSTGAVVGISLAVTTAFFVSICAAYAYYEQRVCFSAGRKRIKTVDAGHEGERRHAQPIAIPGSASGPLRPFRPKPKPPPLAPPVHSKPFGPVKHNTDESMPKSPGRVRVLIPKKPTSEPPKLPTSEPPRLPPFKPVVLPQMGLGSMHSPPPAGSHAVNEMRGAFEEMIRTRGGRF